MEPLRRCLGAIAAFGVMMVCPACGSPPAQVSLPSATPASAAPRAGARPPAQPVRVAVIVMENRGYASVVGLPYISTLATTATALTDYHAAGHPSLPNYLALTSGTTWGIADDGYHVLPKQDIGDQLTGAGVPWRAYMEGIGSNCLVSGDGYAVKHDPFAYYGGRCRSSVVPFSRFSADMSSPSPPQFLWITPNLCDDMHDCSSAIGDAWLRRTVPSILASPAMSNGVLFITWDENDGGGTNQVLTLVLGARRPASPGGLYSHPSLLATMEDLLGVPRLRATTGVAAITLR